MLQNKNKTHVCPPNWPPSWVEHCLIFSGCQILELNERSRTFSYQLIPNGKIIVELSLSTVQKGNSSRSGDGGGSSEWTSASRSSEWINAVGSISDIGQTWPKAGGTLRSLCRRHRTSWLEHLTLAVCSRRSHCANHRADQTIKFHLEFGYKGQTLTLALPPLPLTMTTQIVFSELSHCFSRLRK